MNAIERKAYVTQMFIEKFGAEPDLWSRAPGRVDLMGSHTDYNLGHVMTMTIDRDTWIAARRRSDRRMMLYSLNTHSGGEFDLDRIAPDADTRWVDYVRGVAKFLQAAGYSLAGLDCLVHSTVPFSSGVSSSAALEMAAAVVFQLAGGFQIDPVQMALIGQKAENNFVGVNSGILDQYSSVMGREGSTLLLDCRSLTSRLVPIAPALQVVICDTRARRTLVGTEYGERRAQCEEGVRLLRRWYPAIEALRDVSLSQYLAHQKDLPEVVAKRCRFIIEENQRVLELAGALSTGDTACLHGLFANSYAGARDLYEISAPSMEAMMTAMLSGPGIVAARQAGAGFGGCMVALVDHDHVDAFADHVNRSYAAATNVEPQVYPVRAVRGAGQL